VLNKLKNLFNKRLGFNGLIKDLKLKLI